MSASRPTVLVTAAGAPGCPRLIRALGEAGYRIVGTDANPDSAGSRLCERFTVSPYGSDPGFVPRMREIASDMRADLVFPTSSAEITAWAAVRESFGIPVMAGPPAGVERAADKAATFRLAEELGIGHPRTLEADTPDDLASAARELGYPERQVVMKPAGGKGSRGMRILSSTASRRAGLLEGRPGEHMPETLESVHAILSEGPMPPYIVQEYLEGTEDAVEAICWRGETLHSFTRTRGAVRAGLAMEFTVLDRPAQERDTALLAEALRMDYFLSVQFKGGRLMEINPRVSTLLYTPEINPAGLAVGMAFGTLNPDDVRAAPRMPVGRRAIRYYDQIDFG